ncbi:PAS domain-containing protein [Niveibacterium terrae]|uniref:PAS domain-containing protein n=1 Tax=Niveibacterium terrae TaxID=3373598 RepID=UPI003A949B77
MDVKPNPGSEFDLSTQVLDQLPTPVMAVNLDMKVTFLNAAGRTLLGKPWEEIYGKPCSSLFHSTHCNTAECSMRKSISMRKACAARTTSSINGREIPFEYFTAPLTNRQGDVVGGLEYAIDISERIRNEEALREQARTIREISTPALSLWDGVVVLPVVGVVDSMRAQQMMEVTLNKISDTACKVMILDIQGVPAVDTSVANHMIKIVKATRLMGCQAIISGMSPAVAQTIVSLGIDMGVETKATLRDALTLAFDMMNCEVRFTKTQR